MTGAKHSIERCVVCGLLLTSAGHCGSCEAAKVRKSTTIPDLQRKKNVSKKSENKQSVKPDIETEFQSAGDDRHISLSEPAFLFNKTTKERFELSRTVSKIGRDHTNSVSIADHHISRYHAWILHNKGKFWVEDLGSTNGTLLNGKPITVRTQLSAGDRLTFGKTELIFVDE